MLEIRVMSSFRVRPRFSQTVDMNIDAAQKQLVDHITTQTERCTAKVFPGFVSLHIPEEEQHFWSPRLNLSLYKEGENKTQICGVYGPRTNVWAFFLYAYLFVGFLALISGVFAISQWAIGTEPKALWFFVPAFAGVLGLYISAQMGQKIGAQQTFQLHQVYEAAIGKHADIR